MVGLLVSGVGWGDVWWGWSGWFEWRSTRPLATPFTLTIYPLLISPLEGERRRLLGVTAMTLPSLRARRVNSSG